MRNVLKNIKVSENHHKVLKEYCDNNGLKMYRMVEKWIDEVCKTNNPIEQPKKRDIYGE